jgi:hypothetical protein
VKTTHIYYAGTRVPFTLASPLLLTHVHCFTETFLNCQELTLISVPRKWIVKTEWKETLTRTKHWISAMLHGYHHLVEWSHQHTSLKAEQNHRMPVSQTSHTTHARWISYYSHALMHEQTWLRLKDNSWTTWSIIFCENYLIKHWANISTSFNGFTPDSSSKPNISICFGISWNQKRSEQNFSY